MYRKGIKRLVVALGTSLWIFVAPAVSAVPLTLLLEGGSDQVATGAVSQYASASVSRAGFDSTTVQFVRLGETRQDSATSAVAVESLLPVSEGGNALMRASAGGDSAFAEIELQGEEINSGTQLPLTSSAIEWQTVTFEDSGLAPGTMITADVDFVLHNMINLPGLPDAALDYRARLDARVSIFDQTPLMGPADLGFPNAYQLNEIFIQTLTYDSATVNEDFVAVDQLLDSVSTVDVLVGVPYLMLLAAGVTVHDAEIGQSFSAFADPVFSFDSCTICVAPSVVRQITTVGVSEPTTLYLSVFGFGMLMLRKMRARNTKNQRRNA